MKFRIIKSIKKEIIKKKSMQNLHPFIKREGLGMQRDPCISRLPLSGNHLLAGPGSSPSVDSCHGQNHPDACSDRISIAFSSLRPPGRVDSRWKCALRYSGQLRSHAVTPLVCPDMEDLCSCTCSWSRAAGVGSELPLPLQQP